MGVIRGRVWILLHGRTKSWVTDATQAIEGAGGHVGGRRRPWCIKSLPMNYPKDE